MAEHPLVLVIWTDTISNSGWKPADKIDEWVAEDSWQVHTVGYLLRQTDKYVVLAGSWAKGEEHYGNLIKIPAPWASITCLTEPKG